MIHNEIALHETYLFGRKCDFDCGLGFDTKNRNVPGYAIRRVQPTPTR